MRDTAPMLTVARLQARTAALGPGYRTVIWFHGCSFNCPGCIAAEMNSSTDFLPLPIELLVRTVVAIPGIEGVTLSGGDPFDQDLEALASFLEDLRRRSSLSVMCYTGRTLKQLRKGVNASVHERILLNVDILVDGLYVEAMNDGSMWRGSSNQQVHFLTSRYRHLERTVAHARDRRIEVTLDRDTRLHITGIPPRGFMDRLTEGLRERGLAMTNRVAEEQA